MVKNNWICKIGKIFLLLIMFFVVGQVEIYTPQLAPFGASVLFALLVIRKDVWLSGICYLIANTLAQFNLYGLYISGTIVAVIFITYIIRQKSKLKFNNLVMAIFMLMGYSTYIALGVADIRQNLALALSLVLAILFYFVCVNFMGAFFRRGNILNLDEKVCASTFLIVVSIGLTELGMYGFSFLKLIGVFVILLSTFSFQSGTTFLIASLFGVGYSLMYSDVTMIALFVGFALVSLAFKSNYKILSCCAVILMDVLYGVYFGAYRHFDWLSLLPTMISAGTFLIIPKRWINAFKDTYAVKKDVIGVRSLVNRTKAGICRRMNELSEVFNEMDIVFRNMVKGQLSDDDANELLSHEVINKVCANCPDRAQCMRNSNTKDTIGGLIDSGFQKGKVTLIDVPQYLTNKCGRINFLINTLNQSLNSYKNYTHLVGNMDASRILIADQLGGVSDILKKLGDEIRLNISFDFEKEQRIIEELTYKNIVCYEAIMYEENDVNKKVSLLLKDEEMDSGAIEKAVSNVCKSRMVITHSDMSQIPNSRVVFLKNSPNYDFVFGSASISKSGNLRNGDAHSLIKVDNGKYIVSLCDGIGSGEKAQRISSLSISLIENFYKAGFKNDTILNSINKLLSLNNEENFSSVDLCIMDFHHNTFDFIKLGATYGFIKNKHGVHVIESSGLPIGVLEEMRPHITQKKVEPFDTIILVSDGITDAFDNKCDLQDYIGAINTTNPQAIADEIMDRARDLNEGIIKDDMTVLVARVFPI